MGSVSGECHFAPEPALNWWTIEQLPQFEIFRSPVTASSVLPVTNSLDDRHTCIARQDLGGSLDIRPADRSADLQRSRLPERGQRLCGNSQCL